ncbi:hypothetical protein VIS19158_18461, partial [Vibrio scophthalmi LMG 19158]
SKATRMALGAFGLLPKAVLNRIAGGRKSKTPNEL